MNTSLVHSIELIKHGHPRPREDEFRTILKGTSESSVRYLASLGLPIVHCNEHTAKVFPELLDKLRNPITPYFSIPLDITQDAGVDITENLLHFAINTRPDLYDIIRPLVIKRDYIDLYETFEIKPYEIRLDSSIIHKDKESLIEYAARWRETIEIFYPMIVYSDDPYFFDKFKCPELIEYCIENWDDVEETLEIHILTNSPPEIVARFLVVEVNKMTMKRNRDPYYCRSIVDLYDALPEIKELKGKTINEDILFDTVSIVAKRYGVS